MWWLIAGAIGIGMLSVGSLIVQGTNSAILGLLRQIAIWLDQIAFNVASLMYSVFYEVSSSDLLSKLNLASASQRLYTLLGIFMLFRLAFSFIKYIVNPDDMEKGTSKFISNLAVSLALIVSVPWIFNRAFTLQQYIMDSNVIGNLIMGMETNRKNDDTFNASSYGQAIAFMTFSAFYSPNVSIVPSCSGLLAYYNDYVVPAGDIKVAVDTGAIESNSDLNDNEKSAKIKESNKIMACVNALNVLSASGETKVITVGNDNGTTAEIGTRFYIASQRMDISVLTDPQIFNAYVGEQYVINYTAIVSFIALLFLALLFLNFSFDVAIRNAKLCFLQLIAPIPIILNVEPGDTKGDKKPLNWWIKECLHTYVDLFVRVATVYFGVFLINVIASSVNSGSPQFNVFMMIGILLFVKQIPEMIGKAFGIDVKGQFNLNPLKRLGENRLTSMALGGAVGAVGGLGTGIAAFAGARSNGANFGEALRRGITGGAGGMLHSAASGARRGAKSVHDLTGNVRDNIARSGRIAGANVGTTLGGRVESRLATAVGAKTRAQRTEDRAAAVEAPAKMMAKANELMKNDKTAVAGGGVTFGGGVHSFSDANQVDEFLKHNYNQLTSADVAALEATKKSFIINANLRDSALERANQLRGSALIVNGHRYSTLDEAKNAYVNDNTLTSQEKHNLLHKMNAVQHAMDAEYATAKAADAALSASQNVTLAGITINNTKDAYDHVERLRSSGASVAVIAAAEAQLGVLKEMRYNDAVADARSTGIANGYSTIADGLAQTRQSHIQDYNAYVTDSSHAPINDFDTWNNLKTASGSGNSASSVLHAQADREKQNDVAANARRGGGGGNR